MFLAVDIGNTSVKIGLYKSSGFSSIWRTEPDQTNRQSLDFQSIESWLVNNNVSHQQIKNIAIASVVPELTNIVSESLQDYFDTGSLVLDSNLNLELKLKVDNPKELGIDRIINAVSATMIVDNPIIIIDFGTATTFDVVDKNGDYILSLIHISEPTRPY